MKQVGIYIVCAFACYIIPAAYLEGLGPEVCIDQGVALCFKSWPLLLTHFLDFGVEELRVQPPLSISSLVLNHHRGPFSKLYIER